MTSATSDRRRGFSLRAQVRHLLPVLGVWGLAVVLLGIIALRKDSAEILLDPNYLAGAHWYTGLISNIGILAWAVAAVSAAWCGWLAETGGRKSAASFANGGAVVSILLLSDDLFGFHSISLPGMGVPEKAAEVFIVLVPIAWLVMYRSEIGRTRVHLLGAAMVGLIASLGIDWVIRPNEFARELLLEDGAKFLGLLAWATYFVVTMLDISRSVFAEGRAALAAAHRTVADQEAALSALSSGAPSLGQSADGEAIDGDATQNGQNGHSGDWDRPRSRGGFGLPGASPA